MRHLSKSFFVTIAFIVASCARSTAPDNTQAEAPLPPQWVVQDIFGATMQAYNQSLPSGSMKKQRADKPLDTYHYNTDQYYTSRYGGFYHIIGGLTETLNIDPNTGAFRGGSISMQYTETIVNYTVWIGGDSTHWVVMKGQPYISIVGSFTFNSNGQFGTASDIVISGGVNLNAYNKYNHDIMMNITININSDGSGGDVSGTYDGKTIYFTF